MKQERNSSLRYLKKVQARLRILEVIYHEKFYSCTEEEIRILEDTLGFSLPAAYREFLLLMGHGTSSFLVGSDCFYEWLPLIQGWARELLVENSIPEVLPEDAFVFYMHQGYQFFFLRLSEGENPPIYYYTEEERPYRFVGGRFVLAYQTLADFLDEEISDHVRFLLRSQKPISWPLHFQCWRRLFRR